MKSGDETLTLSGANSYTGGTTISGGTLVASNVEALGTGDITDNATLELNAGGDFANNIGGTGSVPYQRRHAGRQRRERAGYWRHYRQRHAGAERRR
nr:autotransporter-associated beta strand repeat-containing protein [Salmonella enterica]